MRQYEYNDLSVFIGGREITGLRGIEFKRSQEIEALFAKGNEAHSLQAGNITVEGSLKLTQAEYETLAAANNGSVLGMAFNIIWNFGNPSNGDVMITKEIQGVRITEEGITANQGDKFFEVALPFMALKIVNV